MEVTVQECEHRMAADETRISSLEQYLTGTGGLFMKLDAMEKQLDNIVEKIDELDSRLQKVELCMEQQKEARKPVVQMVWNVIGQIVYGITIAALTWWLIGR